jgi:hypothetical protein
MFGHAEAPSDDLHPGAAALQRAAASWERHGFQVRYRDEYLVQLIRQSRPRWALVAGVVALAVLALAVLLRRRWVVVSLTIAPDGRIITLRQTATRPPAP